MPEAPSLGDHAVALALEEFAGAGAKLGVVVDD
jgi:hypothetical protein